MSKNTQSCSVHYVYRLFDPRSPETTRYIGRSSCPPKRLKTHISGSYKKQTYKDNWIQSLLTINIQPSIEVISSGSPKYIKNLENKEIYKRSKINSKLTNSLASFHKKSLARETKEVLGVYQSNQRWIASITLDYEAQYLGSFKSKNAARRHYDSVARYYLGNQAKTNFEGISSFSIEKAKDISNKVLRSLEFKSPYRGITWEKKSQVYKIFVPNQNPPVYITSHKDLKEAKKIQNEYLGGKSIEYLRSQQTSPSKTLYSKYRGVSFNKKDNRFVVNIKLPDTKSYKFLANFKTNEEAKVWHDRVAGYYNLKVNETPDYTISFVDAKSKIRSERNTENKYIGVGRSGRKYTAKISLKGTSIHLGSYNTEKEALYVADAVRNYYGLVNNRTTTDKLSVEQIKDKLK